MVVDATDKGNIARLINHSVSQPNLKQHQTSQPILLKLVIVKSFNVYEYEILEAEYVPVGEANHGWYLLVLYIIVPPVPLPLIINTPIFTGSSFM